MRCTRLHRRLTKFQSTCPARGTTLLSAIRRQNPAIFQSTCPARGTTPCHNAQQRPRKAYFNPRAPRGARRVCALSNFTVAICISIHVPREGHDHIRRRDRDRDGNDFNPRAPRGARQWREVRSILIMHFNPRAPRGARLFPLPGWGCRTGYFNPRAPRGARPGK